jgi:Zn-dependent protease with chaperone function
MILGYPALALNLVTVAILGMMTGAVVAAVIARVVDGRLSSLGLRSRQSALWLFALFPVISGSTTTLLSILPELFPESDLWLAGIIHWHHVYLLSPTTWHGVFLLVCLVSLFTFLIVGARKSITSYQRQSFLAQLSDKKEGALAEVDATVPMAFVVGLWRPQAFITSGLARQITLEERQVISLHEQAHVRQKDPLKKFIFGILTSVYPAKIRGFLQSELDLTLEQTADEAVLQRYSRQAVARSLLTVAKLTASFERNVHNQRPCHFAQQAIERRVHHLIGLSQYRALPVLPIVIFMIISLLCSAASVDVLHHFFETLFLH